MHTEIIAVSNRHRVVLRFGKRRINIPGECINSIEIGDKSLWGNEYRPAMCKLSLAYPKGKRTESTIDRLHNFIDNINVIYYSQNENCKYRMLGGKLKEIRVNSYDHYFTNIDVTFIGFRLMMIEKRNK